jgi:hypothetical protein
VQGAGRFASKSTIGLAQLLNAVAQSATPESSAAAPVHCVSIIAARPSLNARTGLPRLVDWPASLTAEVKNCEHASGTEADRPSGQRAQKSAFTFACAGVGAVRCAARHASLGKMPPPSEQVPGGGRHSSRPAWNAALKLGTHVEQYVASAWAQRLASAQPAA